MPPTVTDITPTPNPLGLTLQEYAAALGRHPQAVRPLYVAMLRHGTGLQLPAITRLEEDAGVQKFCLPIRSFAAPHNPGVGGGGAVGFTDTQNHPSPGLAPEATPQTPHPIPPATLETESVIIPMTSYRGTNWYTLCISSQIGCRMGCTFCQTARMGLVQNLTPAQIVQQRLVARQLLGGTPPRNAGVGGAPAVPLLDPQTIRPSSPGLAPGATPHPHHPHPKYFADGIQNIVFMGMGEPLDNFDSVLQAIRVFNEPAGLDFPFAQITLSTVGRIDGLRKLAALIRNAAPDPQTLRPSDPTHPSGHLSPGLPPGATPHTLNSTPFPPSLINLRIAISLNAATDRLRDQLMPLNRGMPLAELQRTLLDYPLTRKGRFLIEYVLIKGVNDSPADADAVAAWCKPLPCIVNVIPYNPGAPQPHDSLRHTTFETPDDAAITRFIFRLKEQGIFVKRRITHGRDLMGACGQLGNPTSRGWKPPALAPDKQ